MASWTLVALRPLVLLSYVVWFDGKYVTAHTPTILHNNTPIIVPIIIPLKFFSYLSPYYNYYFNYFWSNNYIIFVDNSNFVKL